MHLTRPSFEEADWRTTGELRNRVYHLRSVLHSSAFVVVYGVDESKIWHMRIKHPLFQVLQHFLDVFSSHVINKQCDICYQAK